MNSIFGTQEVILQVVTPLRIHDSLYYDITYIPVGGTEVRQVRVNPEAFYPDPQPGDKVAINVVMGNVMGASKLT